MIPLNELSFIDSPISLLQDDRLSKKNKILFGIALVAISAGALFYFLTEYKRKKDVQDI